MKDSDLKPAGSLALRFGVKALGYGPPGCGKTPLVNSAPSPVMLVTEPGMLSRRGSTVPAWQADTPERIKEFFEWLKGSTESKKFDTVAVDSLSQLAETVLKQSLKDVKDGRAVYGDMSKKVMVYVEQLFFMPNKHVYLICKESQMEEIVWDFSGPMPKQITYKKRVPFFPGLDLFTKVPHLYDEIIYINKGIVPGAPAGEHKYIRTSGDNSILARDRSGRLAEYEPHDLSALFAKAMS